MDATHVDVEPSGRVTLVLPYARPPAALSLNSRAHWSARSRTARQLRSDVAALARQAGLRGPYRHLRVTLRWAPGDRRRRDADNLTGTLKSAVDALARGRGDWVGLDLVPDDTPQYVTRVMPIIVPPPTKGLWLDVEFWDLG